MSAKMKEILAVHRHLVDKLREAYCAALFDHDFRPRRSDTDARMKARLAYAKLTYLVPLQRSLDATVQQMASGGEKGALLYRKKYDALLYRIRDVLTYGYGSRHEQYFGGGVEDLQVLIPVAGVKPSDWAAMRIGDLIQRVTDELAADRQAALKRQMVAEDARKSFLASLTADQWALLQQALTTAKEKGTHAVTFGQRDVPGTVS